MPMYSSSPLGLTLWSQTTDRPTVGQYNIVGNTFSSLFSNVNNAFQFGINSRYNSDIKTSSIIAYSETIPAMKLKASDFAYLKNLGVYPNNRLIIARRFDSGVNDDLTTLNATPEGKDVTPISTLISWVPDNSDFISTEFGEEWTDSEASFKNVLNDIGNNILVGDNKGGQLGNMLAGGGGAVPLPGFTEGLQYEIFKKLGMTDLDAANLPLGNPNLIRESKRRKTLDKEEKGSGLKCKFKIEMVVEYEQKFINGVDPTIVYYDIIANALTFGTSESKFQFRGDFINPQFNKFLNDIGSGDPARLKSALLDFVSKLAAAIKEVGNKIIEKLVSAAKSTKASNAKTAEDAKNAATGDNSVSDARKAANALYDHLVTISTKIVDGLVSKYKLRILGVVNSLTGSPSAPWHVTVGNPRRPIFSSGDMLVEEVSLTMGKLLSFNDLPSSIKLKLTLTSARNIGAQEIYKKFNCGRERTYIKLKRSFVESDVLFTPDQLESSDAKTFK